MDKNYGPKGFEKAWIKALKGFNETKILFTHTKSKTVIKYINNNKLLGIEMWRSQYEIDQWVNHFQTYLDTGIFDTNAYWVEYTTTKNLDNSLTQNTMSKIYAIPMKLEKQLWNVHSTELSNFINMERKKKGDLGFKQVARP